MSLRTQWPYAAKAIVQHEWVVDLLNVWVTFKFPMDQTVKPAHNLWICLVDDVLKAITVSAWLDEWTILLTVPDVAVPPTRVTLEYDGPSENLRITWDKQWEPWGPILSVAVPYPLEAILSAINSNTALDVKFFEDLAIANGDDGKHISIWRNAPEGKDYLRLFIWHYQQARFDTNCSWITFRPGLVACLTLSTDHLTAYRALFMQSDGVAGRIYFGATQRAWIQYNGVNLLVNPKHAGTGFMNILGSLVVNERVSSGTKTVSASADDTNVSNVNTVFVDCSANDVVLGAFVGGVDGQVLHIVRLCAAVNNVTLEHNEGTGNQNIFLHRGEDETLTGEYGGWTLKCNGTSWFDVSHAKHV